MPDDTPPPDEPRTITATIGTGETQTAPWTDRRSMPWPELATLLTTHQLGPKEGACIVPATFRGTRRHKVDAARIEVALLDSDSGATLEEIAAALHTRGWAAAISSTHSHLTPTTRAKRGAYEAWLAKHDRRADQPDAAEAFLLADKGMRPEIAAGATVSAQDDVHVTFTHRPCPKFRVALPLQRPWMADSYANQAQANAAWQSCVEALAAALGLDHDQACTDTSRLFYLPRRPADGPPAETQVLEGGWVDVFALPRPAESYKGGSGGQHGSRGRGARSPREAGHAAPANTGRSSRRAGPLPYTDPDTGQIIDLTTWAKRLGSRFEIATALRARSPHLLLGAVTGTSKELVRCPNEDAHTDPGADAATFVVNASQSTSRGFVIHCRHAHCTGHDRLRFLQQMLHQGSLLPADLEAAAHLADPPADAIPDLSIGSDAEIARHVAADLQRRHGPVIHDEGEFWHHDGQHWHALSRDTLWQAVFRYDGALYPTPKGDQSNVKLNQSRVQSVLVCMAPLLSRPGFFAEAPSGINCASGFIFIVPGARPTLEPHHPDHRQRHVLAGHWPRSFPRSVRKDSLLRRLLHGCFRDDTDGPCKIRLLAEVAGIAALGGATRLIEPKALVCVGKQAENGKSQVLALLRALLPGSAVCALSPARFDDRTFACHLAGKLLNAPDELAGTDAVASEIFKQIITGEPITVRDLYRSAFVFAPRAQHVFATNTLPNFKGGMDRGVRRRLLVLTFNRVIPRAERLAHIGTRVGAEEANLLLDWAVRGAARALAKGGFTIPPSSAEALLDWMYASDPVLAWLESSEVSFGQGNFVPETKVSAAHDKFVRWASDEGFGRERLPAVNGFSQRVEAAGKGIIKKRTSAGALLIGLACTGSGTEVGRWRSAA